MLANQPKNDTLYIKGFNIVVENRAFTYRQVAQNVGQKVCLMPAHYGYLQNNPKVGVFVGAFPENDTVYLINQKAQGGYFDKHIAMFGFLSEQQAVDTYQKCFEYGGYIGLMSVIPCTIEQLKWWLANGDKSRPVTKERLPYAGLERLDSVIWGGQEGADLASHGGQVSKLLYQIRQSDNFNHALEPLSYHDLTQELGNQGFVYENYDALVIEYSKLERKAKQLLMAMQGAADIVKPVGVAVSKPLTKGGVANVVAWFEMDDGQAVGVFFHNPDKTPKKIDPTDEMISYKWVLNKKDITIVVAPENGKDLVVRTVAKRIMKLVDANHDRFLKANSAKAELNLREQELNTQVIDKQAELDALNKAIEALEAQKAEREANKPVIEQAIVSQQPEPVTLADTEGDYDKANNQSNSQPKESTQERPADYRTNLANARAVAKSLGIETKGKKLNTLLKEIDVFDENEVKKELLAEFKALASRLVLPKGYVFDLSDAEKSIGDITRSTSAWIKKQGKTDTNSIRIELRTIPDSSQGVIFNSVHFYTDDKKTKTELDKLNYPRYDDMGTSKPTTPKTIVAKMEDFLTKAVFPKIEYLKVVNSTNVDVSKLSEIGIAEITDIGDENLYFEKDGKYYISKVGNPQLYALGEWDFAKYPDGVVSQATEPEQPVSEPPMTNPDRDLLGFATMAALSTQTKQERDKKKSPDFVANTLAEKWTKALNGDSKAIKDIRDYFVSNKRVPNMTKAHLIILEGLTGQDFNSKTYEYVVQKFDDYINTITQSQEPVATNPDRDYLQSIIDGQTDALAVDIDAIIALAEKYDGDAEMNPLIDQALEVINQAEIEAGKGI